MRKYLVGGFKIFKKALARSQGENATNAIQNTNKGKFINYNFLIKSTWSKR